MFNRGTAVMVLAIVLTIIFAILLFSCQKTDNGRYIPACVFGETKLCVGKALGECEPGYRSCIETPAGASWSECKGIVLPQEEICDGKDNDCDNRIDDGVANACGGCGPVPPEECDGYDNNCNGEIDEGFADFEEICDGYDQDCDGLIDEGLSKRTDCVPEGAWDGIVYNNEPNSRSICIMGWKECRDGGYTECFDFQGPEPEVCDGWDNDCNGFVDEISLSHIQCGLTEIGTCEYGYEACINGEVACWDTVDPQNEICDNLDNDCDENIDEDLFRECSTDCGLGVETCAAGEWVSCNAPPVLEEICDGEDNDCDGQIDEDLICQCNYGDFQPCPNPPCGWGIMICQEDGTWGPCEGNVPQPEMCNNHDDNCNELIDEGLVLECWEEEGELLGVGICESGASTCEAGIWGPCEGQVLPEQEMCDGLDNDCDGVIDNIERFFEKVDMIFVVDISGSMAAFIDAIASGLSNYVLSVQGTEHQFGVVFFGSGFEPQPMGDPYLFLQLTTINNFISNISNLTTDGFNEPSFDAVRDVADPNNPLSIAWRPDATPIVVLIGDENPQSHRGFLIDDVIEYTDVCELPGCNNATNENWQDGDPLELFAFIQAGYMNTWQQACFGPGQRVFNIQRMRDEEMLAIDLALLFQDICIEP